MEGVLFLVFWIGGAAIHTFIEMYYQSSDAHKAAEPDSSGRDRGYESDGC